MSDLLYAWLQDENNNEVPDELVHQLCTPNKDSTTTAAEEAYKQQQVQWLSHLSAQGRKLTAEESTRLLALLTPLVIDQRKNMQAWIQHKRQFNYHVISMSGLPGGIKMQAFYAAMEKYVHTKGIFKQLEQLEWARFLVFVHQVPDALTGLDMRTIEHINHFVERVTDDQLDALVKALPRSDLDYYCSEQSTPDALRRILHSMIRQRPSTSSSPPTISETAWLPPPPPPSKDASWMELFAWCGTQRTFTTQMHATLTRMVEDMEKLHQSHRIVPFSEEETAYAGRIRVFADFIKHTFLPLLSQSSSRAEQAQTTLARAILSHTSSEDLPE